MKFQRRCQLSVEVGPNSAELTTANLVIPSDLTVEFEITRQSLASSQTATFRIHNLNERTRNLLYKDNYATTEARAIQFRAGYEKNLPLCFNGRVLGCTSYRTEGSTEMITEITAYDGGFAMANGFTSVSVVSGTSVAQVLRNLASTLPQLSGDPIIGNFPDVNRRGKVLFGNTWSIMLEQSAGLATIDNGQVKVLGINEVIDGQIPVINSESGLLGSPKRSATNMEFDMIFEPRLTIGQIVQLQSATQKAFNGLYKVLGFTHRGIISPAVNGKCTSTVLLYFGQAEFTLVKGNLVQ